MKAFISLAALAVASFGFVSPAAAYKFAPVNTAFSAHGAVTVTAGAVSLPCTAVLHGTTVGGGSITSASFSGVSCGALTATNLPWSMTTGSVSGLRIHGMAVNAVILGVCGPGSVGGSLSAFGRIAISSANLPGLIPCSVSATLHTTPHLRIVGH